MNQKKDELFEQAKQLVIKEGYCTCSLIQQHFKLGYNRGGRIVDQLEDAGIIGPFEGAKARKILVSE